MCGTGAFLLYIDYVLCIFTFFSLNSLDSQFAAVDALGMHFHATRGSASILGRDDIGQIAEGMAADFFMINMDRLALTGAQFDVGSMLGTVGFKGNVDYTVVKQERKFHMKSGFVNKTRFADAAQFCS